MVRRKLREHVFKMLFQVEFNSPEDMPENLQYYFSTLEDANEEDLAYIRNKYEAAYARLDEIDGLINKFAVGWKTGRMSKVDLTILRLAVYEIVWDDSVPSSVAANEAVELAKVFGGEDSPAFVNGVLGKLIRGLAAEDAENEK